MDQNEINELLKGTDGIDQGDDNISWEDVQADLEASKIKNPKTSVSMVEFEELQQTEQKDGKMLDLEFILDIPLTLTVELGRSRILIGELLRLGQGAIVELSKLSGEPMDILINQRLIARGEVVVVNEKFGVRLTDIVSPAERINKLR